MTNVGKYLLTQSKAKSKNGTSLFFNNGGDGLSEAQAFCPLHVFIWGGKSQKVVP